MLVILCVTIMYLDKNKNLPMVFREAVFTPAWTIINLVDTPSQAIKIAKNKLVSKQELYEENRKLKEEIRNLRRQVQKLRLLDTEIKKYKKLLSATKDIKETVKMARIYQVDLYRDRRQIKINMGLKDCVSPDRAVVDAHGVMGQVINSSLFTSTVQLITDQNHIMPVQFKKNQLRTVAVGDGKDGIKLPNLSISTDAAVGDEIVTSGLGKVYPYGYSVGKITKIDIAPGSRFKVAYVQPTAHLNRAREALVVWTNDPYKFRKNDLKAAGVQTKCP